MCVALILAFIDACVALLLRLLVLIHCLLVLSLRLLVLFLSLCFGARFCCRAYVTLAGVFFYDFVFGTGFSVELGLHA